MSAYALPFMLSDFAQSLPGEPDSFELIAGNSRTGTLRYRDSETGQTYTVPNVPYNQRSEAHLEFAKFRLEQQGRNLIRLKFGPGVSSRYSIQECEALIERTKQAILAIERKIAARIKRYGR